MGFRLKTIFINPKKIDIINSPFVWTGTPLSNKLIRSIKENGILNPPIVKLKKENIFVCVAGAKRIKIASEIGLNSISAREVEGELGIEELFHISIADNYGRKMNTVETAFLCKNIKENLELSPNSIAKQFLPLFGQPPNIKILHLLMLVPELDKKLFPLVDEGRFPLHNIPLILKFEKKEQAILSELIIAYRPSTSKQKLLMEMSRDATKRYDTSLDNLLDECGFLPLPDLKDNNIPQRFNDAMANLQKKVFPLMSRRENSFIKVKNNVCKIEGVNLEHYPYFERNIYSLKIDFRSEDNLIKILNRLKNAVSNSLLAPLFDEKDHVGMNYPPNEE